MEMNDIKIEGHLLTEGHDIPSEGVGKVLNEFESWSMIIVKDTQSHLKHIFPRLLYNMSFQSER